MMVEKIKGMKDKEKRLIEKFKKEKPQKAVLMEIRKKLDEDLDKIIKEIKEMVENSGVSFLPILLVCSDTASDILKIQYLPTDEFQLEALLSKMGEVTAGKVFDAYGFVLINCCQQRRLSAIETVQYLKLSIKNIEGMSRIIYLNFKSENEKIIWLEENNNDSGWMERDMKNDFFKKPTANNLDSLWLNYKLNLMFKK